jgi:hypothetical protein
MIVAWRLFEHFKHRRVNLVFHTSGLTERVREIPAEWLSGLTFHQVKDFNISSSSPQSKKSKRINFLIRNFLISALIKFGLLSRTNTDNDIESLKPWVLEIRGHYTQLSLSVAEISKMMKLIGLDKDETTEVYNAIHYRLGDLMQLSSKTHISPDRIREAYEKTFYDQNPIIILSDSSKYTIEKLLPKVGSLSHVSYLNLNSFETIAACYNSRQFIGTNSKLSLWIALFRLSNNRECNLLPLELSHHVSFLLNREFKSDELVYY